MQSRAYHIAQIATGNSDDALDIVQDAMFKLVQKYSTKPEELWKPLFYRMLHSRVNDWYRRNKVHNRYRRWLGNEEEQGEDPVQAAPDHFGQKPEKETQIRESMDMLQQALSDLPVRQQQAFLLRAWEGMNVRQTAEVMSCAEGSVKTHYSRAIHRLQDQLAEYFS